MSKRKRRKVETILSCYVSSLPGIDWSASVELRTVGHQIEVWATLKMEEELPPAEEPMGVLPRQYSWREAAQLLANSYQGSLGGNFLQSVDVHGFSGMEADVLALAWMHAEDACSGSLVARELLQLDDAALHELHRSERSFLTDEFVEAICEIAGEVSDGLPELIPYCARAPDEPLSLAALQVALKQWQGDEGPPSERRVVLRRRET
jgi:hypothetical protein